MHRIPYWHLGGASRRSEGLPLTQATGPHWSRTRPRSRPALPDRLSPLDPSETAYNDEPSGDPLVHPHRLWKTITSCAHSTPADDAPYCATAPKSSIPGTASPPADAARPNRLISRPPIADEPDTPPATLPKAADTSSRSDRPGQIPPSGEFADPLCSTAKLRSPPCLYHTPFRPTPTHHPVTLHPARPSSPAGCALFLIQGIRVGRKKPNRR